MFATLPGWFLNSDGVASVTFAQPASVGNLLGVISLLTLVALGLILGQGRWSWQSGHTGASTRKPRPKKLLGAPSVAPERRVYGCASVN
jgi:hypothetical protein